MALWGGSITSNDLYNPPTQRMFVPPQQPVDEGANPYSNPAKSKASAGVFDMAPPTYDPSSSMFSRFMAHGAAPMPTSPEPQFTPTQWGSGADPAQPYNPNQYATLDTAANYANWMGGTVSQTNPIGPLAPPPQYGVSFGTPGGNGTGGETLNAGLLANSWQLAQGLYNDPAVALQQFNSQRQAELAHSGTPYATATAVQSPASNGQPANYGGPPASTGAVPRWSPYDPARYSSTNAPITNQVAYPKTGGNPYAPGYTPPPPGTPFDPAFPNYTPYGGQAPTGPGAPGDPGPGPGFLSGTGNGLYSNPVPGGGAGAAPGGASGADGFLADFTNNTGYLENYAKNAGYQIDPSFLKPLQSAPSQNPYRDSVSGAGTTNAGLGSLYSTPVTNAYTDTLKGAAGTGFGVDTSGYAINGKNSAWDQANAYNPAVAVTGATGDPINQLPAWEAMVAAQERNNRQKEADIAERFNVMGGRFSTSFGSALGDFKNQAAKDQNAALLAAVAQASESAAGRKLQANTFLSGQEQNRINAKAGDATQRDSTAGQFALSAADNAAARRLAAGTQLSQIGTAETGYALDKAKSIGEFGAQDVGFGLQKAGMLSSQGQAEAALYADIAKSQSSLALQADSAARDRELSSADSLAKMGFAGAGQLSGQDFQAWQQDQAAAAAAAQMAAGGSDAASKAIADASGAAGSAMYNTSVDATKALYGTENEATRAMFNQQNQSYQQLMAYDQALRQLGITAGTNFSNLNTQNLQNGAQLGAQEFGVDSFNLDRMFQEYLRRQPENSPLLPYLASLSTAQPVMYQPQYKPSAFSEYASAISGLVGAGASAGMKI